MSSKLIVCALMVIAVSLLTGVVNGQINGKARLHYPSGVRSQTKFASKRGTFDPKDLGLLISSLDQLCSSLKFLGFRTGADPKTYLTVPSSCQGTVKFEAPSGGNGKLGDNQLFQGIQLSDKAYFLQSRSCPDRYLRADPSGDVVIQYGPYLSSKWYLQTHNNHMHVETQFYNNRYWTGDNPLKWDSGAQNYMIEFWPELLWP